jgi:hypothetical protein
MSPVPSVYEAFPPQHAQLFMTLCIVVGFQLPLGLKKWGYGDPELFSSFILLGDG